jgi:hypothetical protein
MRKMKEFTDIL